MSKGQYRVITWVDCLGGLRPAGSLYAGGVYRIAYTYAETNGYAAPNPNTCIRLSISFSGTGNWRPHGTFREWLA